MNTLDDTLQQFSPGGTAPMAGGFAGQDPVVAEALATLAQMGAATAQPAPMQQPAMPVGPAAPLAVMQQQTQQVPMGWDQGGPQAPAGPAPVQAPPVPTFTPPKPPRTIAQADADLTNAIGAVGSTLANAADTKFAASQDLAKKLEVVETESVEAQAELQQAHVVARQRNAALVDLESANWIGEMQTAAKKEPNPARWWENQSRLGKAMWALSLLFGAGYAATTPGGKNAAMGMVQSELAQDMEEQRQRLGRELGALKLKGETMKDKHLRLASDLKDDHTYGVTRVEALKRAWMARAAVPGDLDAAAMKVAAEAEFAQMTAPFVERFRKEKLDARDAATARNFQAGQQARSQAAESSRQRLRLEHDTRERTAQNQFIDEQGAKKFERDLALSPVSMSKAYTPGGAIPTDKDGIPVLAEMQAGQAAGLVLKGSDGKGTGHAPRFRTSAQMTAASEVVSKANRRYTLVKELSDILEGLDPGVTDFVVGVTDPRMQARINQLGYEIAKEHDPRVTNQDYSKGVAQGLGFDPSGGWLDRGKFGLSIQEVRVKLKEDLNSMPTKVSSNFRDLNDAAINGQGTELVWDPRAQVGEKAPRERTSAELRGDAPAYTPIESVKDYKERRSAVAVDPERAGELPDHDSSVVDSFIAASTGTGPKTVRAEATRILSELDAKSKELNRRAGAGSMNDPDPWGGTRPNITHGQQADMVKERDRLSKTAQIVETLADDAEAKAAATVVRVGKKIETLGRMPWVTDKWVREQAQEAGLDRASDEVQRLINLSHNIKKKWGNK